MVSRQSSHYPNPSPFDLFMREFLEITTDTAIKPEMIGLGRVAAYSSKLDSIPEFNADEKRRIKNNLSILSKGRSTESESKISIEANPKELIKAILQIFIEADDRRQNQKLSSPTLSSHSVSPISTNLIKSSQSSSSLSSSSLASSSMQTPDSSSSSLSSSNPPITTSSSSLSSSSLSSSSLNRAGSSLMPPVLSSQPSAPITKSEQWEKQYPVTVSFLRRQLVLADFGYRNPAHRDNMFNKLEPFTANFLAVTIAVDWMRNHQNSSAPEIILDPEGIRNIFRTYPDYGFNYVLGDLEVELPYIGLLEGIMPSDEGGELIRMFRDVISDYKQQRIPFNHQNAGSASSVSMNRPITMSTIEKYEKCFPSTVNFLRNAFIDIEYGRFGDFGKTVLYTKVIHKRFSFFGF